MSRRGQVIAASVLGVALILTALAPFVLMLLPNPRPVAVADLAKQLPGNYIRSGSETYHVFPRAERTSAFPADSLAADPSCVFVVKYRQLAQLDAYTMWSFDTGKPVMVTRDTTVPKLLQLKPNAPLAAGRYYVVVARESIYGGEDYVYFSVGPRNASR